MATRADYGSVAQQIASYLNAFHFAFKTYQTSDFEKMLKAIAGEGARLSGGDTTQQLETAFLERGFRIYPSINNSSDGYVRVIRTNSIVGNLLNAFLYVGSSGDDDLAALLIRLKKRPPSDFGEEINESGV